MLRSEINRHIAEAEAFFESMRFMLPPWSTRGPSEWKGRYAEESEIVDNGLGWDLTDFGSGSFDYVGLLLFTLRNGKLGQDSKPYAEKIMMVGEGQVTPTHFHWSKMEDIIVRGGGNLLVQLWPSTPDERRSEAKLSVRIDGALREFEAGSTIRLSPGMSVCLEPKVYHRFYGESGKVLVGEVSAVNDDKADNRFLESAGRFPRIEEDAEPKRLLVSDYSLYV